MADENLPLSHASTALPAQADMQAYAQHVEQKRDAIEKYQAKLSERFADHILGTAILPPSGRPEDKGKIIYLILIDDTDSKKMQKQELRDKLQGIFAQEAKLIDEAIEPETLLLSELWGFCFDAKYDVLVSIAQSTIIYDKGMLSAIKLAETHKQMVLKKFEKYIVCYVLAGSLTQGSATTKSDVDVFIVIDDTDVKKMTRAELKDKLRAIIIDMGYQAGDMTGIQNKINIQVYILTDFWDNIKEANPVIFTFLRDGVPFYDRGVFMPWKQLLEMGKVKPSQEAIDVFMSTGEQMLKRTSLKLKEMAIEDFFWALSTPSQAALMLYGLAPPSPKELAGVLRDVFVRREELLEEKYVEIWERVLKLRKDLEHGTITEVKGAQIDELLADSAEYLKRLNKLFDEIAARKDAENILHTYENAVTVVRDALRLEGVTESPEAKIVELFEKHLVHKGLIAERYSRLLADIINAKKKYDKKKLEKTEIGEIVKTGREFFRVLLEHIQRSRARELERSRLRVKVGERISEALFLEKHVLVVEDVQQQTGLKAGELSGDERITAVRDITVEEYEKLLSEGKPLQNFTISEKLLSQLGDMLGGSARIMF
jgi:uncharacterized protein (UPF0332 family)/predicted nucleotidyltransferase